MPNVKEELKIFGETTSFRGVSRIIKSKDKFLKIVWILAVLACTAVLVYLLVTLFTKFFNWPVTTRFGEDDKGRIVFPDVTVCSLNRFLDYIDNKDYIEDYFNTVSRLQKLIDGDSKFILEFLNSISGFMLNKASDINSTIILDKVSNECFTLIKECVVYYENWQFANSCNYNVSYDSEYGLCLTIKASEMDIPKNRFIRGMSLILDIGPPNLNAIPFDLSLTSSQAHGASISIHPIGTSADMKRGLVVGPGTEAVVKIVQTNIERLDKPHNAQGCTEQKTFTGSPNEAYTLDLCNEHCMQKEIFRGCGCVAHWFDVPDTLSDAPYCANYSEALKLNDSNNLMYKVACSARVVYLDEVSTCEECKLPCKEISYQYTLTSAPWPPPSQQISFYRNKISECARNYSNIGERFAAYDQFDQNPANISLKDLKEIGESFMIVKLVIEDQQPFLLKDKPFYSWDVMVSLVGGTLSLWLGVTAMTLFEVLELLYRILKGCIKKSSGNNGVQIDLEDTVLATDGKRNNP